MIARGHQRSDGVKSVLKYQAVIGRHLNKTLRNAIGKAAMEAYDDHISPRCQISAIIVRIRSAACDKGPIPSQRM